MRSRLLTDMSYGARTVQTLRKISGHGLRQFIPVMLLIFSMQRMRKEKSVLMKTA